MVSRVVLVTKRSPLEELVLKHLTFNKAEFALKAAGQSIATYVEEDSRYQAAVTAIRAQVPNDLPVSVMRRDELANANFQFRDTDLIVVCGPDGLFVNVARYVRDQVVLTVNPGVFGAGALMLFPPSKVGGVIASIQNGTHHVERLPLLKAVIDDERVMWAASDIFVGRTYKVSAWYELLFGRVQEVQGSDGVLVSSGIGSTGWIQSVVNMVEGLTREGTPHKLKQLPAAASNELVFVVQNPISSPTTGHSIITGRITPSKPLSLNSRMPEGGFIFSDGMLEQAEAWNAGSWVAVTVGDRYVQRIVP